MVMAGKRSVTSLFKRLSEVAAYKLRTVLAAERRKRKDSESKGHQIAHDPWAGPVAR